MATIKRKPAQEDDISLAEDAVPTDSVSNEAMNIDGVIPTAPPGDAKAPLNMDNGNLALARAVSGATPALMGFLFGASPAAAEREIKEGQAYYAAGAPKKAVLIKGPNGEPIYSNMSDSMGMEAYQKPLAVKPPSAQGFKIEKIVDPITKKETYARVDLVNKTMEPITYLENNQASRPEAFHPKTTDIITDIQGNQKTLTKDAYGNISKGGTLEAGIGAQYNLPKEEVELGNKYAEKTALEMKPYIEGRANVKAALDMIRDNPDNKNAIVQAAGIFRTAKMVVNERISEPERQFVTAAPGMLDDLANKIATGVTGAQRDQILSQMRQILVHLDEVQKNSSKAVQDTNVMAYSGGEKNKVKYLSDRIVNSINTGSPGPSGPAQRDELNKPLNKLGTGKYTRQQLEALTPQQRQRILDELKSKSKRKP